MAVDKRRQVVSTEVLAVPEEEVLMVMVVVVPVVMVVEPRTTSGAAQECPVEQRLMEEEPRTPKCWQTLSGGVCDCPVGYLMFSVPVEVLQPVDCVEVLLDTVALSSLWSPTAVGTWVELTAHAVCTLVVPHKGLAREAGAVEEEVPDDPVELADKEVLDNESEANVKRNP